MKKQKKQNNIINRNFLISLIFILLISLFIFSAVQGYSNLQANIRNNQANSLDIINQRMSSVLVEINSFPRSAGNDILFLSRLSSLRNIINAKENNPDELEDLKSNLLEFLKENTAYYQLRYVDETGQEVVRVDFDGKSYYVVPEDELQNKKHRGYFEEARKLNLGEVYISTLDLNIEQRKIENRGTEKDPLYVPVIRYATPLFDDGGKYKGIIISNIYADYFLDDIRMSQRKGETIFLINNKGYYLANPDREKEFSFMFDDKEHNFYDDYPEIAEKVLSRKKRLESDNQIFTFRYFHPTSASFEVYEGSKKIFGENPEQEYHWILVSISEKGFINKVNDDLKNNYFFSLLIYGLFTLVVIVLLLFLEFNFKQPKKRSRKKRK